MLRRLFRQKVKLFRKKRFLTQILLGYIPRQYLLAAIAFFEKTQREKFLMLDDPYDCSPYFNYMYIIPNSVMYLDFARDHTLRNIISSYTFYEYDFDQIEGSVKSYDSAYTRWLYRQHLEIVIRETLNVFVQKKRLRLLETGILHVLEFALDPQYKNSTYLI